MKSFSKWSLLLVLIPILWTGCRKDDPVDTKGAYSNGIFIVNQGLFQTGKGTLSFYSIEGDSVRQDVFEAANNGQVLGNVAQSAVQDDEQIYIAINNSEKIVVADKDDLVFVREITGIAQPRYMQAQNDLLVASAWGDGFAGSLNIYNANTGSLQHEVKGLNGPEQIYWTDSGVLVPCSGGFGTDNKIFLVNPQTGIKTDSFIVGDRPQHILKAGNDIFALCSGKFDWVDPTQNTDGGLWKWNGSTFVKVATLPNGVKEFTYLPSSQSLYFLEGDRLGKYQISNGTYSNHQLEAVVPNGLSTVTINGISQLAVADAVDYVSAGKTFFVDSEGKTLKSFGTGIIPGFFLQVD